MDAEIHLSGRWVQLDTMTHDDIEPLVFIAKDESIWKHFPWDGTDSDSFRRELKSAMLLKINGEQHPFTIRDKASGQVIGSTRFFDIFPTHKKLEIGWTWMHPHVWGKGHNLEAKFLLLQYCFEVLKFHRVQLKTRDNNFRSRKAIEKIGGKFEGTLRKDRIGSDGITRDTVMYSIVDDEWSSLKEYLTTLF